MRCTTPTIHPSGVCLAIQGDLDDELSMHSSAFPKSPSDNNVFQRLQGNARQIPYRKQDREAAKQINELFDKETGQVLYRPLTGRSLKSREK